MRNLLLIILSLITFASYAQQDTVIVKSGQQILIIGKGSTDEPTIEEPDDTHFYINTTNNIDHYPNIKGKGVRYFWNVEHDLPARGILKDGGKLARDHTFIPTTEQNNCLGVNYDGTMCDNATRIERLSTQFEVICVVPQSVRGPFENWLQWPSKFVALWIWGNTPGEQYTNIRAHFLALLWSTHGRVKFAQIANEPWSMTPEEYNIVESARMDAWIEYNLDQGRTLDDYESFTPKLITAAMPIGQGLQTQLTFQNLANSRFSKYYHSVGVHAYNKNAMGEWSTNESISNGIIDLALEFCKEYMPHCQLQVTETGAPQAMIDQHIVSLRAKAIANESIYAYWLYNLFSDNSGPLYFGDLFFVDKDGNPTETAIKYNLISN